VAILFKERISKFGSLISLIALTAMLALYSLSLPEFLASPLGRAFAAVWAALAIIIFLAHARRLSGRRQRFPRLERAGRARKPQKEMQREHSPLRD
jgi:hypothetical protein